MINVHIICVGNLKEKYIREAASEYEKRLSSYCKLTTTELDSNHKITGLLSQRAFKIALCVEGIQLSSEELAKKIEKAALSGYSDIDLIIGGAEGLPENIKAACDYRLSFSRMTFPHRLMRVILLEQIYRAFTIIHNEKYHK